MVPRKDFVRPFCYNRKGMNVETAYSLLEKGKELLKTGNPAQAAVVLERAKKIEPNKGSIREALARAYYNYGQYVMARCEFKKAIEIDPTNHYAHFGLGLCFKKSGDRHGALRHLKLAVAMEPGIEVYRRALDELMGD
ncbi:MAG TPA: hypothetical protein DCW86_02560 [Actinobacteria bacterium]|nr:hypothetical protein [Actinomycetota bacterium]